MHHRGRARPSGSPGASPWPALATGGSPRRPAEPAAAADFPAYDSRLPHLCRDGRRDHGRPGRPPGHRRVSSIGKSYQGRDIWAAKVSDNVAIDEDEPEVLFDWLHHAREHLSLEQDLAILRWLTDGYGTDPRITDIVDTREIWIVFAVNPDGGDTT